MCLIRQKGRSGYGLVQVMDVKSKLDPCRSVRPDSRVTRKEVFDEWYENHKSQGSDVTWDEFKRSKNFVE
jgi:hypothetical protein